MTVREQGYGQSVARAQPAGGPAASRRGSAGDGLLRGVGAATDAQDAVDVGVGQVAVTAGSCDDELAHEKDLVAQGCVDEVVSVFTSHLSRIRMAVHRSGRNKVQAW